MTFPVLENLRGFFNSRPPLVVFMICLGSFAVALITFAYIVKVKDIQDPDISEDWNTFLEKFSQLQLCSGHNSSAQTSTSGHRSNSTAPSEGRLSVADQNPAQVIQQMPKKLGQQLGTLSGGTRPGDGSANTDAHRMVRRAVQGLKGVEPGSWSGVVTPSGDGGSRSVLASAPGQYQNVSVGLRFLVTPNTDLLSIPLSQTLFVGAVLPDTLGINTAVGPERIHVSVSFSQNLSQSQCQSHTAGTSACVQYTVTGCVTFSAPAHLLPDTIKPNQEECRSQVDHLSDLPWVRDLTVGTLTDISNGQWCPHGAHLRPEYTLDDSLTVFLSVHDKSMINLHLMHTSYFLFVLVLSLFCYGMVKGRPAKIKVVHVTYDKV